MKRRQFIKHTAWIAACIAAYPHIKPDMTPHTISGLKLTVDKPMVFHCYHDYILVEYGSERRCFNNLNDAMNYVNGSLI